jgi:hypothetical protein
MNNAIQTIKIKNTNLTWPVDLGIISILSLEFEGPVAFTFTKFARQFRIQSRQKVHEQLFSMPKLPVMPDAHDPTHT